MDVHKDRLDSRLRLTCLAAIRDGEGLAGRLKAHVRAAKGAGLDHPAPITYPGPPTRTALHGNCGARLTLLSYQVAKANGRQCSSEVQQPGRLTSDLHRPDMAF